MNHPLSTTGAAADPSESNVRDTDVLSGRGKVDHDGNKYFRHLVQTHIEAYHRCQSVGDRSGTWSVVQDIIDGVRVNGGRFMTVNFRNKWVEMSYKDTKDKTDRACRDAVRKLEKNHTKYRAAVAAAAAANDASATALGPLSPPIELSLADVFSASSSANYSHNAATATTTAHSSPLLAVLAASSAPTTNAANTGAQLHHTSPAALTDLAVPLSEQQSNILLRQQQQHNSSLQQSTQPHTTNPGLEHSCSSLFDATVAIGMERRTSSSQTDFGGTMEFSTGSLDVIAFKCEEDDDDEKKCATAEEEEDGGEESSMEYCGIAAQGRQGSIRSTAPAVAATDSCMSLDLCSIEAEPAPCGTELSSAGSTHITAGSSLRDHSDVTLRTTGGKPSSCGVGGAVRTEEDEAVGDEEMLVESFHRSLDFRE